MGKRASRVITFILILIIFVPMSFGTQENGHFVGFRHEAEAATPSFYYDKYTVKTQYEHQVYENVGAKEIFVENSSVTRRINDDRYRRSGYTSISIDYTPLKVTLKNYDEYGVDITASITGGGKHEVYLGLPGESGATSYNGFQRIYYRIIYNTDGIIGWHTVEETTYVYGKGILPGTKGNYIGLKWLDITEDTGNFSSKGCKSLTEFYIPTGNTKQTLNTLVELNIIAPDGSYPDNGLHTDGYWYVKKATSSVDYYDKYSAKAQYEHEVYTHKDAHYYVFETDVSAPVTYLYRETLYVKGYLNVEWNSDSPIIKLSDYGEIALQKDYTEGYVYKPINSTSYKLQEYTGKNGYWTMIEYTMKSGIYCGTKGNYIGLKWLDLIEDTENNWDKSCLSMTEFYVPTGKIRETANTLVESNIIAPDGTYPNNGIHTDGYWYVKKSINSPAVNEVLSKWNGCTPSITVADPDGDTLTCKYYIDSVEKESKTISNTATAQLVNFSTLDVSTLLDGRHTFKFEVSDGNASPMTMSVDAIVDNSPPSIGTVNITADTTNINISGSATDTVSDAASIQYRYTAGGTVSNWVNNTSYTVGSLTPNTAYSVKFEARDKVGNISHVERTVTTKAQTPQIAISNNKENTLDLSINDSNPTETQYQILAGSSYVSASGNLVPSQEWIKVSDKKITVTGLAPNTQYMFSVKAKNRDGYETTATQKNGTTLATASEYQYRQERDNIYYA